MKKYALPSGIVKACSGIIESAKGQLYVDSIVKAEIAVGKNFADNDQAQAERQNLIKAIKLNLINRHEYSFEYLKRKYNLPVSHSTFKREKMKYCYELARLCGLI